MRLLVASRQRRMGPASARRVRRTLSLRKLEQKARTTNPFAKAEELVDLDLQGDGHQRLDGNASDMSLCPQPGDEPGAR